MYRVVERATGDDEYAVKVIPKKRGGIDPARILMRIREEVPALDIYSSVFVTVASKFACVLFGTF